MEKTTKGLEDNFDAFQSVSGINFAYIGLKGSDNQTQHTVQKTSACPMTLVINIYVSHP